MSISVTCPECFMEFAIPDRFAGKKIKCKSCGGAIPVPAAAVGRPAQKDEFDDFSPAFSPPALPARTGQTRPAAPTGGSRKKGSSVWMWVLGIAGGAVLAVLLCCGGVTLWWRNLTSSVEVAAYPDLPDFGDPTSLYPVKQIPVPKFPDLGPGTPVGDAGVQIHEIDLGPVAGNQGSPGMKMTMRVYLPPGELTPKSIPCVLVAPAGTTLLTGMALDASDYHDETLPYAEAGMAVIHYSLDGDEEDFAGQDGMAEKGAYLHFRAACAGAVNTRNALEFALAKLPMVDPKKVFTAGHSSAGTLALLAAEHEPRLAGAVAYAPAADVVGRMKGVGEAPAMVTGFMFPQLKEFLTQSSPLTHLAAIKCPVFLFHSKQDDNTPFADTTAFADKLRAAGKDVTLVGHEAAPAPAEEAAPAPDDGRDLALQPPSGFDLDEPSAEAEEMSDEEMSDERLDEEFDDEDYDDTDLHYAPMIEQGIPKGIEWIKSRTGG